MKKNIRFEKAEEKDLGQITAVSIKSFHSDILAGAKIQKGPPGYDSVAFHKDMIKEATSFYKIISGSVIVGAFWIIIRPDKSAYLYRIFIDPSYHRMGIGLDAVEFLIESFPEIKKWSLKTPVWNSRTSSFYKKAGFEISETTKKFIYFMKNTD